MKKNKVKDVHNISSLGAAMRNRIGVLYSCIPLLTNKYYKTKRKEINNIISNALDELTGMSALPEVEDIKEGRDLMKRIRESRKEYIEYGERMSKHMIVKSKERNK